MRSSSQKKKKNFQYIQQYWTPALQHEIDILTQYQHIPYWQHYFSIPVSIRAVCIAQMPSSAMYLRDMHIINESAERNDENTKDIEDNKNDQRNQRLYIRCMNRDTIQPLSTYISSLFTLDKRKHCIYDISIQLYRILSLMSAQGIFHTRLHEFLCISRIDYNLKLDGCTTHSFTVVATGEGERGREEEWLKALLPFDTSRAWLPIELHILTFLSVASYLSLKDVKEIVENVWSSCCSSRMIEMGCYTAQDKMRCLEWATAAFANKSAETVRTRVMKYAGRWNYYLGFYAVLQLMFEHGLFESREELRRMVQEVCPFYPVSVA